MSILASLDGRIVQRVEIEDRSVMFILSAETRFRSTNEITFSIKISVTRIIVVKVTLRKGDVM